MSVMCPLILFLVAYTTSMLSHVNGLDEKHRAAYKRIAECVSLGTHANLPDEHLPAKTAICDAFKVMYPCVTQPLDPNSKTELWDFYQAYELQRIFLANKGNMCGEPLAYQELKELVKNSGIMERENLPNVENDEYVPCEGEISMKCLKASNNAWESHSNDLRVFLAFIDCYAKETPTCDFPIAHHMNAFIQAFRKHMEEKHGLLSGMLKEIKQ